MRRLYHTTYQGPTDFKGSRFIVKWVDEDGKTRQKTVNYDFGASNAGVAAVAKVAGVSHDEVFYMDDNPNGRGSIYLVN